jgi:hypothetical protein
MKFAARGAARLSRRPSWTNTFPVAEIEPGRASARVIPCRPLWTDPSVTDSRAAPTLSVQERRQGLHERFGIIEPGKVPAARLDSQLGLAE